MKQLLLILILMSLASPVFSQHFTEAIDPAILLQHSPQAKMDPNDPETVMRNFQAMLIQSVFLEPALGKQANFFGESSNMGEMDTSFVMQMMLQNLSYKLADEDIFQLNKQLKENMRQQAASIPVE